MYALETLKKQISVELEKVTGKKVSEKNFSIPPEGDLSVNVAFEIAKEVGKNPKEVAEEIAGKLTLEGMEVKAVGPYLNFFFDYAMFSKTVLQESIEDFYGSSNYGKERMITIDYSSVNVAKPMHVGHLRSTVIGNSLYKLLEYVGFKCFSENYLGDWGLQFGKLLYAYNEWGSEEKLNEEPIKHLTELYVKFHDEENDELKARAIEYLNKLEHGDSDVVELWARFRKLSLEKFEKIYALMGIEFDSFNGEAFYSEYNQEIIKECLDKGVAKKEEDGTIIIPLEEYGLTNARLLENNRTLYITREIAAAKYRKQKYNFYRNLYVVGSAQTLHFQQLFKILELLGYPWYVNCEHVKFGMVSFPEGKMSTRKGQYVELKSVLDEAVKRALEIINEKNPELENKEQVAEKIGIGAVKFADLSQNRIKDVVFDIDKMVSFEGDTSPYLQYAYVRCKSILGKNSGSLPNYSKINEKEEKELIKKISEFPEVVLKSAVAYEPHQLSQYLLDLAHLYSGFYEKCKVTGSNERIQIVKATANVLKIGLRLLGIEVIERM